MLPKNYPFSDDPQEQEGFAKILSISYHTYIFFRSDEYLENS